LIKKTNNQELAGPEQSSGESAVLKKYHKTWIKSLQQPKSHVTETEITILISQLFRTFASKNFNRLCLVMLPSSSTRSRPI